MSDAPFDYSLYPVWLAKSLQFIWGGDRDGHESDSAPGETFSTRWGITEYTWGTAIAQGIVEGDFQTCTQQQCATVYWVLFGKALGCDHLNPGVALVLFNDGTLTGVGHTARLLQRCLGFIDDEVDGVVGIHTEAAANAMAAPDLIAALITADETYLASLANAPQFLNGWTRREEACKAEALSIA